MKEVNKSLILTSAISEINSPVIKKNELDNYLNFVLKKLDKIGYTFDRIDNIDISYFCEANDNFVNYKKDGTIWVTLTDEKFINIKNQYQKTLPQNLKEALKYDKRYILPIIEEETLMLYYINFKNKIIIEDLQKNRPFKSNKYGEYIVNLDDISDCFKYGESLSVIEEIYNDSLLVEKDSYNLLDIEKINTTLSFMKDTSFEYLYSNVSDLKFFKQEITTTYKEISDLYTTAKSNQKCIEKIKNKENNFQRKKI